MGYFRRSVSMQTEWITVNYNLDGRDLSSLNM